MRRWAIGVFGCLVAACGSILGVGPLTADEPDAAVVDSAPPPIPTFDAAPEVVDASLVDAAPDAQCFSTPPTPPRTVTQAGDGNGWNQLDALQVEDGTNAVGTGCCSGDSTATVTAANFGFDIPTGAQIQGVTIRMKARSNPGGLYSDGTVKLAVGGALGTELKNTTSWPAAYETRVYGNPVDTDGLALTPESVTSPDFAVRFHATKPAFTSAQATFEVDVLQVSVFYCR